MAQDDYYYEIQLTNKQLVFYFMAGATLLILSFLTGVMVGRGVDSGGGEVRASRVQEDRIVAEEAPPRPSPPPAEDLTYAQRLEGDRVEESLSRKPSSAGGEAPTRKAASQKPTPTPAARSVAVATPAPTAAASPPATTPAAPPSAPPSKPTPSPKATAAPAPTESAGGTFTIQVGAFKDKSGAESVVERLKEKGFAAYVATPEGASGGLFNVRVGSYPTRAEAERVQNKLRDEEKFKPFIVRQ